MEWIALDLGSTHTKCAVLDSGGEVVRQSQLRTPPALDNPSSRHETDAEAYFQLVYSMLRNAVSKETAGMILSTQMHGYVLTDSAFSPVSPFVSWQDRAATETNAQGKSYLEALLDRLPPDAMAATGVPLKANLAMCMLYARMCTGYRVPEGALFNTLGGYIIGRLTGEHVCHSTNAAPTGMLDVRACRWDSALITAADLNMLQFSQVLDGYHPAGVWQHEGREIPVMPDVGDHQVCVYSADLPQETGLHINIGTAGLMGVVTRHWSRGTYEMRPWLQAGLYLQTVSGLPGGRVIDLMDEKGIADSAETYREAMERLEGVFDQIGFSGGCALHNEPLRKEILRAMGVPENKSHCSDVMRGMGRLAQMAERIIYKQR
jgi:sugar (pentulose or hexulose) kinase